MLAIAKAMTALFALLEPKIASPNFDTLFYFHSLVKDKTESDDAFALYQNNNSILQKIRNFK
jgi:hypothetical protein